MGGTLFGFRTCMPIKNPCKKLDSFLQGYNTISLIYFFLQQAGTFSSLFTEAVAVVLPALA